MQSLLLQPLAKRWATIVIAGINIELLIMVTPAALMRDSGCSAMAVSMTVCSSSYWTVTGEETHIYELRKLTRRRPEQLRTLGWGFPGQREPSKRVDMAKRKKKVKKLQRGGEGRVC